MKHILSLIFILSIIFFITGCDGSNNVNSVKPEYALEDSEYYLKTGLGNSCSEKPSCLVSIEQHALEYSHGNITLMKESINSSVEYFYSKMNEEFLLDKSDYTILCAECDINRGGYIKSTVSYKDGSDINVYYRWGWCSSGGSDCGFEKCFESSSEAQFNFVRSLSCTQIDDRTSADPTFCGSSIGSDETAIVRASCMSGGFETEKVNSRVLSIKQISNRCSSYVERGLSNCMQY